MSLVGLRRLGYGAAMVALSLVLLLGSGGCDGPDPTQCRQQATRQPKQKQKNYVNVRAGSSSGNSSGKMVVCMEGSPTGWLSLEACGTGANLWAEGQNGHEISHYRVELVPYRRDLGAGRLRLQLGVGFAELQIDADESGFDFSGARNGVETAGAEAAISAQYILSVFRGWDLLVDTTAGYARFNHADKLIEPQPINTTFADISLGVGW